MADVDDEFYAAACEVTRGGGGKRSAGDAQLLAQGGAQQAYGTDAHHVQQQDSPVAQVGKRQRPEGGVSQWPEMLCKCGLPCIIKTSNSAKNPGRDFYKCDTCDHFQFCDQAALTAPSNAYKAPPKPSADFDPDEQPHPDDIDGPPEEQEGPKCICGVVMQLRTSNSAANPGRQFYACDKQREDPTRCGYFNWSDQPLKPPVAQSGVGGVGSAGAGAAAGTCFQCGGTGHWARDCPQKLAGGGSGAYGGGGGGPYGGGGGANAGSGGGGGGSGGCFTCGQTGHWSRDCPQKQASGGGGGYNGGGSYGMGRGAHSYGSRGGAGGGGYGSGSFGNSNPFGGSSGTAFGGGGGGRGGSAGSGGGGSCYKCGQSGHWARDCRG